MRQNILKLHNEKYEKVLNLKEEFNLKKLKGSLDIIPY
jgi:hypothetical protein